MTMIFRTGSGTTFDEMLGILENLSGLSIAYIYFLQLLIVVKKLKGHVEFSLTHQISRGLFSMSQTQIFYEKLA